jgi:hypothetical protein
MVVGEIVSAREALVSGQKVDPDGASSIIVGAGLANPEVAQLRIVIFVPRVTDIPAHETSTGRVGGRS